MVEKRRTGSGMKTKSTQTTRRKAKAKRAADSLRSAFQDLRERPAKDAPQLARLYSKLELEIKKSKRAESKLRESQERYRRIFESALVSIREEDCTELVAAIDTLKARGVKDFREYLSKHPEFLHRAQNMVKIIEVNDATVRLYGAKSKKELMVSLDKTLVPESLPIFREELIALAAGEKVFEGENINQTLQGQRINILLKILYPPKRGKRNTAVVSSMDITELKRSEEALRESETRYRALYASANDAILLMKRDQFVECNTKALETYGGTRNQILGSPPYRFSPKYQSDGQLSKEKALTFINTALEGKPQIFEWQHCRYDGSLFDAEVSLNRLVLGGTVFLQAIVRDITPRKQAEVSLRTAFAEIEQLKKRLEDDYTYLREEIKLAHNFDEIVGESDALKHVLYKVEEVAATDIAVLILGETGVGKELIARAIHNASSRKDRPLVKVNCAALPANLIESELFGHEKGAFSGAHAKQVGRFELADGSTIFLDEIGELPLELQAKLLRVLQDGEFERLGSPRTLRTNARIIAATNRSLEEEVRRGSFRKDLWYRINVFPITAPPLRERREDIPLLAEALARRASNKLGKKIEKIPLRTIKELQEYSWPGNVREMENVIERAVINSKGPLLVLADRLQNHDSEDLTAQGNMNLAELERMHIVQVLEQKNWKISGKNGAAALLGLNPSTLRGKMRKLGLRRGSTTAHT